MQLGTDFLPGLLRLLWLSPGGQSGLYPVGRFFVTVR